MNRSKRPLRPFFNDDRTTFFAFYKSGAIISMLILVWRYSFTFLSMSKRLFCLKNSLLSHKNQTFKKQKAAFTAFILDIIFKMEIHKMDHLFCLAEKRFSYCYYH